MVVSAIDRASAPLNRITGGFNLLSKTGLQAGLMFGAVTVGMQMAMQGFQAIQQYLVDSIQKFREFETAMAEVNTMLTEQSEHYLPDLQAGIQELAVTYGQSAVGMAKAMYQVLSASVDAGKAVKFLEVATRAATAGLTESEVAVDAITSVMNSYGMSVEESTHISDVMFMTIKRGKLRFDDLARSISYVAPISAQAGISFEEISAALATLTRQGIDANKATRGLRQLLANLISPSTEAADAAMQYGIVLDDLTLNVWGLEGTLKKLEEAAEGNIGTFTKFIPNVRALQAALGLTGAAADGFTHDIELMEDSVGSTDKALKKMLDTNALVSRQIEAQKEILQRQQGEALQPLAIEWDKFTRNLGMYISTGFDLTQTNIRITASENQLAAATAAATAEFEEQELNELIGDYNALGREIIDLNKTETMLIGKLQGLQQEIPRLEDQLVRLKAAMQIQDDLYAASTSLKGFGIEVQYSNREIQDLVETLNSYNVELDRLRGIQDSYNQAMRENQIEIAEIKWQAAEEGRELTDEEEAQIEELEHVNERYRIDSMRGALDLENFRKGIYEEQKRRYDEWVAQQQDKLHTLQDNNQQEINDMQNAINQKYMMQEHYEGLLVDVWNQQLENYKEWSAKILEIDQIRHEAQLTQDYAYAQARIKAIQAGLVAPEFGMGQFGQTAIFTGQGYSYRGTAAGFAEFAAQRNINIGNVTITGVENIEEIMRQLEELAAQYG